MCQTVLIFSHFRYEGIRKNVSKMRQKKILSNIKSLYAKQGKNSQRF